MATRNDSPAIDLLAEMGIDLPENTRDLRLGHLTLIALSHEALAAHEALRQAQTALAETAANIYGQRTLFDDALPADPATAALSDDRYADNSYRIGRAAGRFDDAHLRVLDLNQQISLVCDQLYAEENLPRPIG